jgi:hypothetical protein
MVTGTRAIPVFVQGWRKLIRDRSQNTRENTFLRFLADVTRRAGVTATILCDRGFRRASWLALLQTLRLGFIVRLMADVYVELEPGVRRPLEEAGQTSSTEASVSLRDFPRYTTPGGR